MGMGKKRRVSQVKNVTPPSGAEAYDAIPYESFSYSQTHPEHMAVLARVFGLPVPDVATARVLEIGCAGGGNLFSQAYRYPGAQFTGFDYSPRQIERATFVKSILGLDNVTFSTQDIMAFDLAGNRGKFDYVICHGIFSWVPAEVRERILDLCAAVLSPEGLAVISYNALPGWNAVRSLREMMIYHTAGFKDNADKIRHAREFLAFLAESIPASNVGYRAVIEDELRLLKGVNDTYVFHDHLEGNNTQFYFHDFAKQAADKGLAYLGDPFIVPMYAGNLAPKAAERVMKINDPIVREQYIDFILNRRFRFSVMCKAGREISRSIANERIMDFYLSTNMKPESAAGVFVSASGSVLTTADATLTALMLELARREGKPVAAQDLVWSVQRNLGLESVKPLRRFLVQNGMMLVLKGHVTLHHSCPDYVTHISERPVIYPLARKLATIKNNRSVVNVFGSGVKSSDMWNFVLQQFDGTRSQDDVIDHIVTMTLAGKMNITKDELAIKDPASIRAAAKVSIGEILAEASKQALLVG